MEQLACSGTCEEEGDDEAAPPPGREADGAGEQLGDEGGCERRHREVGPRDLGDLGLAEREGGERPEADEPEGQPTHGRTEQDRDAHGHPTQAGHGEGDSHGEAGRSAEHTSELQSLMRNSYAVVWMKTTIHTLNKTDNN